VRKENSISIKTTHVAKIIKETKPNNNKCDKNRKLKMSNSDLITRVIRKG